MFSAVRASPSDSATIAATASGSTSRPRRPRPRSASATARRTIVSSSDSVSRSSTYTRQRESSAAITSNDGFSVVAPIRVTVPRSTCGRNASCWALLKRWISSTKRIVRWPWSVRRSSASRDEAPHLLDAGEHGGERGEVRLGVRRRAGRRASSSRCPAGPRGSSSGGRPTRWRREGGARVRGDAPGRRTRRGSAAASARRAGPPRADSRAPPARTAPRRPAPWPPGPSSAGADPARPPRRAARGPRARLAQTQDATDAEGDKAIRRAAQRPRTGRYQAAVRSHSGQVAQIAEDRARRHAPAGELDGIGAVGDEGRAARVRRGPVHPRVADHPDAPLGEGRLEKPEPRGIGLERRLVARDQDREESVEPAAREGPPRDRSRVVGPHARGDSRRPGAR